MIAIYPDCNALWRNINLSNQVGERLRKRLSSGSVELRISPVVIAELRRRADEELHTARAEAVAAIERATRAANTNTEELVTKQHALFDRIAGGIGEQFVELLTIDGVFVEDWPSISARELGERELERRRPFLEKAAGTIGLRDAIIWAGVVESLGLLWDKEGDIALFVSKDEGFKADKTGSIHSDLDQEVKEVFGGRFELLPSLFHALTAIELQEEAITRREANIRNALSAFVEDLDNEPWDWPNTELPPEIESRRVLGAQYLGSEVISDGNPAQCTFQALVEVEGAMLKDHWYLETDSEVQLWDGEINDHYMSVYVKRVVEFEVEVDVDVDGNVDCVEVRDVHL